jgi:hypothetical protein
MLLTPIKEFFDFAVTNPKFFDAGLPVADSNPSPVSDILNGELFQFFSRRSIFESSAYIQDHFNWKKWSFNLRVRCDNYRFLIHDSAWSPRIAIAYFIPKTQTRFHFSYDRAYQTPSIENLLLSSSLQAQILSPLRAIGQAGGLAVPTSRADFFEAGISQTLGKRARLNVEYFHRKIRNFADDDVFFNTGINFPISLYGAQIKGAEARLELQNWKGFSGFASYSYLQGIAFSPITGGLFLGDNSLELIQPGLRFPISQDQRNTIHCQVQFQRPSSRWWLATAHHYESGLPVELDEGTNNGPAGTRVDPRILNQVNLVRGRIKPRHLWDLSAGAHVWGEERQRNVSGLPFKSTGSTSPIDFTLSTIADCSHKPPSGCLQP